ncbi:MULTISPECIES: TPM domain-containing protein [unclassified Empedobacter]|uniref:TPM domain-containing protein n=1 Tax=unclassified Empedobacter TaxID=2643773 RepID=UPI0025BBB397|nr:MULTISPECIES: TPM domain-containing protein [unclassified Empedobacter]
MKLATVKYFFLTFFLSILTVFGQTPDELVKMEHPPKKLVQDYAHVFDAMQLDELERKLVAYDDSTSTQILVLTVKSLDGYPLEMFANDIGEKWKVGTQGKDNGVVIVLSEQDRKITIRTGYGAQIYLPPSVNKSIIDNVIIPYFKQGDYAGGINAGVNSIFQAFAGKYKQDKAKSQEPEMDWVALIFAIGFFIFIFIIISKGKGGNNDGNGGRRRSLLDDIIIMNTGSSVFGGGGFGSGGSSWGGSSGGGFGGFGGGSFGGGGASGSW